MTGRKSELREISSLKLQNDSLVIRQLVGYWLVRGWVNRRIGEEGQSSVNKSGMKFQKQLYVTKNELLESRFGNLQVLGVEEAWLEEGRSNMDINGEYKCQLGEEWRQTEEARDLVKSTTLEDIEDSQYFRELV